MKTGPRAFQPPSAYPELAPIQAAWRDIRGEALASLEQMAYIEDGRADPRVWRVLPIRPEDEDRAVFPEDTLEKCRALAPRTIAIVERSIPTPTIHAYAFSALRPGGFIRPHTHENPYVTASLCLDGGLGASIIVEGERRDYIDGELLIFDYRLVHEVIHNGDKPRVVLLMLLEDRRPLRRI